MPQSQVRVRFAPSPTGFLHIGGARTALYNWLYAKRHGGVFCLRIEDTDLERSEERFTQDILGTLKWLGLQWDEDIVFQSKRLEHYAKLARQLVEQGDAYYCQCSEADVEAMRERQMAAGQKPQYDRRCREKNHTSGIIRAKLPLEGHVEFTDLIRGEIRFENRDLDDFVLLRSNLAPTYNFTVVVDDVDMKMSHIIRGDDHINNTPKQLHIYKALGAVAPKFAHLPMILGDDKKKLSKRHGAVSTQDYRAEGYLPEALLNFLVRLGWSHGDQEIFSVDEMCATFDFDAVQKSGAVFNREKLLWTNGEHLRRADPRRLRDIIKSDVAPGWSVQARERLELPEAVDWVSILQPKVKLINELAEQLEPLCWPGAVDVDASSLKWGKDPAATRQAVRAAVQEWLQRGLGRDQRISVERVDTEVRALCERHGLKLGDFAQPVRLFVSGRAISAGVFELLATLPWSVVEARLQSLIRYVS